MFNNLNNPNSNSRPPVDDIFAETDKHLEGLSTPSSLSGMSGSANSEIVAHKVGVVAAQETETNFEPETRGGLNKKFKIILFLIGLAIIILGGYIVYSSFFVASEAPVATSTPIKKNPVTPPVVVVPEANTPEEIIPEIPGVNAPATPTSSIPEASSTPIVTVPVDSDSDGLTDDEEKLYGTNPNLIDTDNDGLSDYEEVKIYSINPLLPDTDGDSYLDGAEVKGSYNPNGTGKLASSTPSSIR